MKFYFVYVVPEAEKKSIIFRIFRKIYKMSFGRYFCYFKNKYFDEKYFGDWPVHSPYENTKNIFNIFYILIDDIKYVLLFFNACR